MKRLVVAVSIMCVIALVYACSRSTVKQVSFIKNNDKTMEQMIAEAKLQKKILFVDVYTTWCGPCKWMDENTFKDLKVSDKFNKTFLNYKVDGESFDGVNVGIIYHVNSFPTYLFISPKGEVLHRIEGVLTPEVLIQEADFVSRKNLNRDVSR